MKDLSSVWDNPLSHCSTPSTHDDDHQDADLIESVADALQFISYYHPMDYIRALGAAYEASRPGGEGRDRADPDQQPDVRRRASADLPGHRHRQRVRQWGRTAGSRLDAQRCRRSSMKACAAPISTPRTSCAPRSSPIPPSPAATPRTTRRACCHVEMVPGDKVAVDVAAKGGGSENKSKFKMMNPSDSIVDWVLEMMPQMGAGWCPPGMLGIGIGGTAEKAMLLAKESADGADRHGPAQGARARRTISRSCGSRSSTRSTRSASARRGWAGCRPSSTSRSSTGRATPRASRSR